jgi:putative transposase
VEIIIHCVWLYYRFPLSLRDVQEMMLERGRDPQIRQSFANELRRHRPRPSDKWHLDEVFIKIGGRIHYLWRSVDQ